eukprot:TRINITY_DN27536_c0_g1_i1.p1 TRINITY_DN27536_c0_g1~~TRINITY_DN27536_c0_g1_i1.p1  ORF type:complete len:153 (+),score=48.35 TRINITY_DN27536_c0_g1_i1:95-553(+)
MCIRDSINAEYGEISRCAMSTAKEASIPLQATLASGIRRPVSHTEATLKNEAEAYGITGAMPNRAMFNQWTKANIQNLTENPDNRATLVTLGKTMAIMGVLPLMGFFLVYRVCVDLIGVGMDAALAIGGVVAVVLVNAVSLGYSSHPGWLEK